MVDLRRRARRSTPSIKINKGFAEFYGAMIGDGCLSRYFSSYDNRYKYCVLLTGHTHDEPYYRNTIRPIFRKVFGIDGCIRFKRKDNVVRFETVSKRIFYSISRLGFPTGIKDRLYIPKCILGNSNLSLACIRGVFDTDGSVYSRYSKVYKNQKRKYTYANIEIKMNSEEVIRSIKQILDANGIKTAEIRRNGAAYILNVHHQGSVRLFFKKVKPSNKYHIERFLNLSRVSSKSRGI